MEITNTITEQDIKDLALMLLYVSSWKIPDRSKKQNRHEPQIFYDVLSAWKGIDFDILNSLEADGFINNGSNKSKSLAINTEGQEKAKELLQKILGKDFVVAKSKSYI